MKSLRFSASLLAFLLCGPAMAMEPLCPYYGGHVDVEGKFGSQRDIGETSVFLPLACSEDKLLFTDLRFKGDNQDNREGNVALGIRDLRESGIIGGYIYFDRKQSGFSEKYFSQITLGSEWLAEDWEVRANGYLPLNDERDVLTGESIISDPFLAGTGIFTRETGLLAVRETPLYGGDVEAGFKIPGTEFWLHAAAFSFNAEDAPSLEGVRARATFQITDNIALTAEGQYDDERGRQGWVGARLTLPFGGPAQKQEGLKARMTASPVRDIDIVTQTEETVVASDRIIPVLNTGTGNIQRILYIDNSAAGGGDGSLDNPFNTLAVAQAALQDNDVLYIAEGDGGTTGMQSGLSIARQGVQVIGGGVDFVFDGSRFTTRSDNSFNGFVLREATAAPKITNTSIGGDGITVTASDVSLTGLAVQNANRHGIYAYQTTGGTLSNLALSNLEVTGSGQDGVRIEAANAGSSASAAIANVTATGNKNGIRFYAQNNASVSGTLASSVTTANTQHGVIVYDDSTAGAVDVDLGGGGRSMGNNALFGNTLEDLAVDIDGATLTAQNNWWGQASGRYQSTPSGGLKPQIYYGAPINDGLAGHWTFDSEWTSNTTAYDRSGNSHDGTLSGGMTLTNMVTGRYRQALNFNGTSDFVVTNSFSIPELGGRAALGWLNLESNSTLGAIANRTDEITLRINGRGISDRAYNSSGTPSNPATISTNLSPLNNWAHWGLTHYSTAGGAGPINLDYYFNGVLDQHTATGITGQAGRTISRPVYIGRDPAVAGRYIDGSLDDIRIYNRALTADEVAQIHRMNTSSVVDTSSHRTTSP